VPPAASGATARKSLAVRGVLAPGGFFGWSGATLAAAGGMMAIDLSAKHGIHFWTKGDGHTYAVMIFSRSHGMMPLTQNFVAGPEWKEVRLPFSAFAGYDGHDLISVAFAAANPPGAFSFLLTGVAFE
jgi:hypothetical protein